VKATNPPTSTGGRRGLAAIILAAGKGTRMPGDLPKVAHRVADRAMVEWVVDAVSAVGARPIVLVVGYREEVIRGLFGDREDVMFVTQREQLGTANAVDAARDAMKGFTGDVVVLCGDGPLIRPATIRTLVERHRATNAAATLATSVIDDPTGYGRIVREHSDDSGSAGRFRAIVEHRNATPEQRAIREVNPSYYCFDAAALFDGLRRVKRNEMSGEYYVTDVPGLLVSDGKRVEVIDAVPPEDVLSINTPEELARVDRILSSRLEACR